ncbi:hypothetical protein Pyn_20632 [Prunus yedoensis var. nudiflora]|uniref:Uncharacterized protein n=1 Tax=Prunus yedoensis var. nudiflora TaxID=2094558 RepID=A0A314UVR4_PRUYE|nr:hypothetical protein Pyn_20632 [Prunus yedoensis var. nudiflora]
MVEPTIVEVVAKLKIASKTALEPRIQLELMAKPKITQELKIALEPVTKPKIQLVELKIALEPMTQPKIQLESVAESKIVKVVAEQTIVKAEAEVKMAPKVALEPKIASLAMVYPNMALDAVLNASD